MPLDRLVFGVAGIDPGLRQAILEGCKLPISILKVDDHHLSTSPYYGKKQIQYHIALGRNASE